MSEMYSYSEYAAWTASSILSTSVYTIKMELLSYKYYVKYITHEKYWTEKDLQCMIK